MTWVECLLIICGISFSVFAQMECQGSLIAKVNKTRLMQLSILVAGVQLMAFWIGHLIATWICDWKHFDDIELELGQVLAGTILICLGVRQIILAVKHEKFEEIREEAIPIKSVALFSIGTSFYSWLAGVAMAFAGANMVHILILVAVISVLAVIFGVYTGLRFGFVHKIKAQLLGAALLIACGIVMYARLRMSMI